MCHCHGLQVLEELEGGGGVVGSVKGLGECKGLAEALEGELEALKVHVHHSQVVVEGDGVRVLLELDRGAVPERA